jgi:hypothetical protein
MKRGILGFSGVKIVNTTYFGSVKLSTLKQREDWLKTTFKLGRNEKK